MRFTIHVLTTTVLIVLLSVHSVTAQTPSDIWRNFAQRVGVGTELNVQLSDGRRIRATLVGAEDDVVLLQPKTRLAVPVQAIRYDEIIRMEPRQPGNGTGKAVAIGVVTAVGTFFGILALLAAAAAD